MHVTENGTIVLKVSLVRYFNTEDYMDPNLPSTSSNTTLPPPSAQTTEGNKLIEKKHILSDRMILYMTCTVFQPSAFLQGWKTAAPSEAVRLFMERLRREGDHQPLQLTLNAGDTDEERDGTLISFYKKSREMCQWAADFRCSILGIDTSLTHGKVLILKYLGLGLSVSPCAYLSYYTIMLSLMYTRS